MIFIAVLFSAFFSLSPAWAASAPSPVIGSQPLSWEDCVRIALKYNPDLNAARKAIESARAQYYASWNELLPSLTTLEDGYTKVKSAASAQSSFLSANGVAGGGSFPWTLQGTAKMDIFNFKDSQDIRKANAFVTQMLASYQNTSATVRYNLRNSFFRLLYAYGQVAVANEIRDLRKQNAQMVSLLYDNGSESQGNLMLAQAQLKQADFGVHQNVRRLRLAAIQLDQLLGQGAFSEIAATGTLEMPEVSTGYPEMSSLIEQTPSVRLQEAIWQGSKAGVGQSLSAMLPNVSVLYTRSSIGNNMLPVQSPGWSFFGAMSLPIFSNGPTGTYFTLVSARRTAEQNKEQLRSVRLSVRATLETAWYNLANDAETVAVDRTLLQATRQRNDESTIRYNAGLMPYETWELAVNDLVNAEQGLITAEYTEATAWASWEQAEGLGLEE